MHKIDGAGHFENTFVQEDALTNTPPTLITDAWLNAVQAEPVNVIEAAGLELEKADNTQLLQALNKMYKPRIAVAAGTANALTADFTPDLPLTHGQPFWLRITSGNTTTTPTLAVDGAAALPIVKGNNLPLAASDLLAGGWAFMQLDTTLNKYVLLNPATGVTNSFPPGMIIDFSGSSAPSGYLACPLSATNVSRTTYAALFAAIGTTWGVGDGATTFGLPWFPADYASVQANANVGTNHVGEVIAHTHNAYVSASGPIAFPGANGSGNQLQYAATSSTGGTSNRAAGVRLLKCIKY